MTGYTRQSLSDIQDGEDVIAEPLNREFNAVQTAFNSFSGHTHDGTVGNGPKITLTNSVNGILPVANGGTGPDLKLPVANGGTGPDLKLPVANGGTGSIDGDTAAVNLGLISAKDLAGTGVVAGTADVITLDTDRNYTTYTNSTLLSFKASANNTTSVTLNVDGVGAKPIKKITQSGDINLEVGDIYTGGIYIVRYDTTVNTGTGAFILVNSSVNGLFQIGDFFETIRTLDSKWLRRNGGIYNIADYPTLAALLPALPDGVTWTTVPSGIADIKCVIEYPGGYVALGTSSSNCLAYQSPDGEVWELKGTITTFAAEQVAFGNGIFVAVDGNGKTAVSSDLVTWSSASTFTTGAAGIGFGNGVFVGVGVGGQIKTTPNGVTWTTRTSGVSTLLHSANYENSVFIVTGASGVILTSPDGTTWTSRVSGVATSLKSSAFGGGRYVVVGTGGVILTSTNLSSWSPATSGTVQELNDIRYTSSGFLAAGASGTVVISLAGTSWASAPTGSGASLRSVAIDAANPARYLVGGSAGILLDGIRTLPTQFGVPNDDPTYGWIKAL